QTVTSQASFDSRRRTSDALRHCVSRPSPVAAVTLHRICAEGDTAPFVAPSGFPCTPSTASASATTARLISSVRRTSLCWQVDQNSRRHCVSPCDRRTAPPAHSSAVVRAVALPLRAAQPPTVNICPNQISERFSNS
ncbi:hypothetical protein U1Q18_028135, partial [Sarracenia purpurea var. burkii]